jgi:hypothetical protein
MPLLSFGPAYISVTEGGTEQKAKKKEAVNEATYSTRKAL